MNKTVGLLLAAIVATIAVVVAIWQTGRVNERIEVEDRSDCGRQAH